MAVYVIAFQISANSNRKNPAPLGFLYVTSNPRAVFVTLMRRGMESRISSSLSS